MERKEFLKLAGAAAAGSLLARCSPAPEAWNGAKGEARITVKIYELKLRQAWGLSRGTWTTRRNAFVRIERDGIVGLGEAAPIARYSETAESAAAFIEKARPVLMPSGSARSKPSDLGNTRPRPLWTWPSSTGSDGSSGSPYGGFSVWAGTGS
ncbi:MAG: Muconate cycloisomerase [Candidatus Aminicenantes bacterium]|nr:Muconate cycloisomerase [Candidatus Aminicenantes bacterium]